MVLMRKEERGKKRRATRDLESACTAFMPLSNILATWYVLNILLKYEYLHKFLQLGGHYVAYTALPYTGTKALSEKADDAATSQSAEPESYDESSRTASFTGTADPSAPREKTPSTRKWCYISDTIVRLTTLEEVMKAKAYICMYERV